LSGPIRKQHDFFFATYERFDVPDLVEINALVPLATNPLFPLPKPNQPVPAESDVGLFAEEIATPETLNTINARVDLSLSQSHTSVFRVDAVRGRNDRGFPGGTRLAETILRAGRDSSSIGVSDFMVFRNRLVNQARFQYSRLLPRSSAKQDSVGVVINSPRVTAGGVFGSVFFLAFGGGEKAKQIEGNSTTHRGEHIIKKLSGC